MIDLVNISLPNAGIYAVLGYLVVFLGLVMLMIVIMIMGKIMTRNSPKAAVSSAPAVQPVSAAPAAVPDKAPGSAGEFKLNNTDPRDAAMVMAIVADTLGRPLNELRFISIREVKEDEV